MSGKSIAMRDGERGTAQMKAGMRAERIALARRALARDPSLSPSELAGRFGWTATVAKRVFRAAQAKETP